MSRNVRITRILAMTDYLAAAQMQGLRFAGFLPPAAFWQPAVNVYINSESLEVCMDLAGVRRDEVAVRAVWLSGAAARCPTAVAARMVAVDCWSWKFRRGRSSGSLNSPSKWTRIKSRPVRTMDGF